MRFNIFFHMCILIKMTKIYYLWYVRGSTLSTLLDLIFVITSLNHQAGSCGFLMIHFNSTNVASVDGEEEWLRQIWLLRLYGRETDLRDNACVCNYIDWCLGHMCEMTRVGEPNPDSLAQGVNCQITSCPMNTGGQWPLPHWKRRISKNPLKSEER